MTSSKTLNRLRILALLYFIAAACVTAFILPIDNSVRAPLLTLIGTASLILILFPAGPTITNIGAMAGTVIVMGGSGAWFLDATQGESFFEYLLFQTVVAGIIIYVAASVIISTSNRQAKLSPEQSKSTDGRRVMVAFVTLALAILISRVIRSSFGREKRGNKVD